MSATDEDEINLNHEVHYLRYLLESGLDKDEVRQIAEQTSPTLEVCFEESECVLKARHLERGKQLVMLS